jgi:hypothetical protein
MHLQAVAFDDIGFRKRNVSSFIRFRNTALMLKI